MAGVYKSLYRRANKPFYIDRVSLRIYSVEELCYIITENAELIEKDIFSRDLAIWLEGECGARELAAEIIKLITSDARLVQFVKVILECAPYISDEEKNEMSIDLEGPEMGILIGKRGQTLDSLQYLTSLFVNKKKDKYIKIKMDTENYRARRKETLENLAKNIAYKVKKSRRQFVLEPMNPYERRIIHSTLQQDKFVATRSEGEEPYRKVVVYLKKK